ncbi:MAG: DUF4923 family protein [Bacteroidaceae bacterium]
MKQKNFLIAIICLLLTSNTLYCQSLKDLFSPSNIEKAVSAVAGTGELTAQKLQGNWTFVKSACELKTDNIVKGVGGSMISSQLENKLDNLCAKAGIKVGNFGYDFKSDSIFTNELSKGKPLSGTYSFNEKTKTLTLNYGKLLKLKTLEAKVTQNNGHICLLFNADKLLKLLSTVAKLSKSTTMGAVDKIAAGYDGILIGFELKK